MGAAAFFSCYHYYYCNWGGEDCPYLILKFGLWIFVTTQLICEVFRTERVGGVRTEEGVLRIITNAMSFQFIIDSPLSFPYIIPKFYVKGGGETERNLRLDIISTWMNEWMNEWILNTTSFGCLSVFTLLNENLCFLIF